MIYIIEKQLNIILSYKQTNTNKFVSFKKQKKHTHILNRCRLIDVDKW